MTTTSVLTDRVRALIAEIGFPAHQPIAIAARGPKGRASAAAGRWSTGEPVRVDDRFYAASLTKQVTGAAIASLVSKGMIDPDAQVPRDFLPRWPDLPTVRQVLHHVASLPEAGLLEGKSPEVPWTNATVMSAAAQLDPPRQPIGTGYVYSNIGYVMLARLAEHTVGVDFSKLAAQSLPMSSAQDMSFADEASPPESPHALWIGAHLPLSTGDGGLWTTAEAYADFLDLQNLDRFETAALTQANYTLPTGEAVGYGWGIGIRGFRGHPLYIHGGSWTRARSKAVRCPSLEVSVVVLTAGDEDEPVARLADAIVVAVA